MAFQGNKFIFDGIPGETYGLMVANINNANQNVGNIGGKSTVHESRTNRRSIGLDYGVTANEPLSFPITFVSMEDNRHFDRYDIAAVAGWLTGHQSFKKLVILQSDMENVYYKCRITKLEAVEVGMHVVGFAATVTCDGPYAYRTRSDDIVVCAGSCSTAFFNASNVNDYYYPVIELSGVGQSIRIDNCTDGTAFVLSDMPLAPTGGRSIYIDCLNQVMTASDGINLYQYWNTDIAKCFPRFLRGANALSLSGSCTMRIHNDFPWNVGN